MVGGRGKGAREGVVTYLLTDLRSSSSYDVLRVMTPERTRGTWKRCPTV